MITESLGKAPSDLGNRFILQGKLGEFLFYFILFLETGKSSAPLSLIFNKTSE
jgi:hypothetical protein